MDTESEGEDLRAAVRRIEPAMKGGPIRLIAADSALSLSACDGELLLTASVPAEVRTPGEVVVRGRTLQEFVKASVGDKLNLTLASELLEVQAGDGRITLGAMPSNSWSTFEHLPLGSDAWPTELTLEVGRVLHAAAKDPAKGPLYGVSLADGLAVATDGYRLAAIEVPLPDGFDVVVPTSLLHALLRAGLVEAVHVTATDKFVTFESSSFSATSLKILGSFPNWQSRVPSDPKGRLTFDRLELLAALSRMAFLTHRENLHTVEIESGGPALRLTVDVPDVGRQVESLKGSSTIDPVSFNARYLKEMAEQMYDDEVTMLIEDAQSPALIQECSALAMVFPVRR